jgi:hypothetical protein
MYRVALPVSVPARYRFAARDRWLCPIGHTVTQAPADPPASPAVPSMRRFTALRRVTIRIRRQNLRKAEILRVIRQPPRHPAPAARRRGRGRLPAGNNPHNRRRMSNSHEAPESHVIQRGWRCHITCFMTYTANGTACGPAHQGADRVRGPARQTSRHRKHHSAMGAISHQHRRKAPQAEITSTLSAAQ